MISSSDSMNTLEYKDHFVIVPNSIFINWDKKMYLKKIKVEKIVLKTSLIIVNKMKIFNSKSVKKIIKNILQ